MLTGFNEIHLQIKKFVSAVPKQYALLIKRREAPHFWGAMSRAFWKKGGEKIKMESQKPDKQRLRDSESLYIKNGAKYVNYYKTRSCNGG